MENEKIKQLAEFLGIEPEQIEVSENDNEFFTPEGTYTVMTEDEAKVANTEYIESFIYECGLNGFSEGFQQEIKNECLDNDRLENWVREDEQETAYELSKEDSNKYANRLVEDSIDRGFISEEDLTEDKDYNGDKPLEEIWVERSIQEIEDSYDGNVADYITDNHGDYLLECIIKADNSLIDIDEVTSRVVEADGYGHNLASWDCTTNETEDFYVFKQSDTDDRTQEFLNELENDDLEY